jgi:hypothetical protein
MSAGTPWTVQAPANENATTVAVERVLSVVKNLMQYHMRIGTIPNQSHLTLADD